MHHPLLRDRQLPEPKTSSHPGMPALTWWLVGLGTRNVSPAHDHFSPSVPALLGASSSPGAPLSPLRPAGPGDPCMPGAPTPPEEGIYWRNMAESVLSRYHFLSSAACHAQLQVRERPGRLLLTAWSLPGTVSGKFSQCGKVEGEAQARVTRRGGSRLFQALCTYLGPHQGCPCHPSHLPPSPTTHHPPAFGPSLSFGAWCARRSHAPLPP